MEKAIPLTGAKAIIECLKLEGTTKVFCVPGESYLPVLDCIHDEPNIQLISTRHEGGAAFMAEGYAKASGSPGIVMATRGVGGSNLAIGVHTAYQDSTPMVVFLGQVHSKFRGREGFQEIDLDRYFSHIAKWTVEIKDAERIPELVQKAFRIARTGRPGPVVVSLPEDVLVKDGVMEFGSPVEKPTPSPSPNEVCKMENLIQQAERPLIIAGGGIKSAGAENALAQFAEAYSIPVMAAFRRHDVLPNNHELYVGHLGLGMNKDILQTVAEADTIIALGTRLSEVTTQDYSLITKDKTLIHMDIDYETIGKVFAPTLGIVADMKVGLEACLNMKIEPRWLEWASERRSVYVKVSHLVKNKSLNHEVISILQNTLPQNAVITNDAGNFAGWLHAFYQFNEKNTYVGPTSGAMGYGMPAAIGVKLAQPDRVVVSLSGDGGFMMTMQEIETTVRYNIPVICIIFNNNMYGTIRMHQEIHYPYKMIGTDLGEVPFAAISENLGATGFLVRTAEEFKSALTKAMDSQMPAVIEVMTNPEQISVSSTIQQVRNRHKT